MEPDDPAGARTELVTTPPSAAAGGRTAIDAHFADWEAYEVGGLLGEGGMGAVYRARHRALGRTVALKFILGAHPRLIARFLQEARAQARIDHPNICRVYEVGELAGRPYIAMQFVDGEQLGKAARTMSFDDKAVVMRDIASAVHEAHKLGIVHRDLKPSNIVVERGDDARWTPVVMDFGLAREVDQAGLTESGALLGTPAYMAPEQARGQTDLVDRRSDIYSLGATFYEMLTGRPPFAEASTADVLHQLLHRDPPAPRTIAPQVPVDLETIALQCLAKDPERRYPSARALADDLDRYLDGAPIFGRRPSLWTRLRARARRNRPLVITLAVSLVAILGVAGLGIRAAVKSRQRAALADELARDSVDMEWRLGAAYLSPLHDATPERDQIRKRMQQIAEIDHDLGALGDGAIHEALGRGHLALREWQRADEELRLAEEAGLDHASLHYARGRALGERYHLALEAVRHAGDKAWLAKRQREIDAELAQPALAELERSRIGNDGEVDPQVLEALIALYRRDFATAERLALAAAAVAPSSFEARTIAADAVYAAGVDDLDHGRYVEAEPRLDRAIALYDDAATVGRSDATIHAAAAKAMQQRAELDQRTGRTPKATLERALAAIEHALVADPKLEPAYVTRAYVLIFWYRVPALRSAELTRKLDDAAAAAVHATEIDAGDARAWDALGTAYLYRGFFEASGARTPWLTRARTMLEKALALEPNDPWAHNDLGVTQRLLGSELQDAGKDPRIEYAAAQASFERATAIDPEYVFAFANQIDLAATLADYQLLHGTDPSAAVARAQTAAARCLAIDPSFYKARYNLGEAQLTAAKYLAAAGRDPRPMLTQVRLTYEQLIAVQPKSASVHLLRARAAIEEARSAFGSDASTTALADAHAALARAIEADDRQVRNHTIAAELALLEAREAERRSDNATPALERALAEGRRAVELDVNDGEAAVVCARAYARLARTRDASARQPLVAAGLALIDAALSRSADDAEAHLVHAALLDLADTEDVRTRAAQETQRAFAIDPLLRGRNEW